MENIKLINLNKIKNIILYCENSKHGMYKFIERTEYNSTLDWFLRKGKKKKYIQYCYWGSETFEIEEFQERRGHEYYIVPGTETIIRKAHVKLILDNDYEERFFDSNEEAEMFFNKLKSYAHGQNLPFIDFKNSWKNG